MNRVSKLTARIESLRDEEIELKNRHAESMIAQSDDDFGDVDRKAVKKISEQLQSIRAEIEGLEDAMDRAAELDAADVAAAADQKRLAEFREFEASLQPRMEAAQRFEAALAALVATIREVQAADDLMPAGHRGKTPWQHGLAVALEPVLGRGVLPGPRSCPQPYNMWDRADSPVSKFVHREHRHRAYHEAVELHRAGLLANVPERPETVSTFAEPTKPEAANRPTFCGTFEQMGDGFFVRPDDHRIFEKTPAGFIEAADHPGYPHRRTVATREIA